MDIFDNYWPVVQDYLQIILTVAVLVVFIIGKAITRKIVRGHANKSDKSDLARISYVTKSINFGLALFLASLIAIIWNISFQGLSIYFASFFTIAGVALFAQWSILSNITASVILFFFYPYRIGSKVKIIDGDNSIEGLIIDITLFAIIIETEDKQEISYPNSLAMQKPMQSIK